MALWAQSTSGQRQINLGLPSLKTWLKNLAANGPGRAETYQGVTYKFVKPEPPLPYRAWINWMENHWVECGGS
ncbi:hypothetical protein N7486_007625 [Penicillium sp. IBT 16267x]|nr:hypothetical protein N7486_007625 [Penicillium sp. IBT 16267x]